MILKYYLIILCLCSPNFWHIKFSSTISHTQSSTKKDTCAKGQREVDRVGKMWTPETAGSGSQSSRSPAENPYHLPELQPHWTPLAAPYHERLLTNLFLWIKCQATPGSMVCLIGNCQNIFESACTTLHSHQQQETGFLLILARSALPLFLL